MTRANVQNHMIGPSSKNQPLTYCQYPRSNPLVSAHVQVPVILSIFNYWSLSQCLNTGLLNLWLVLMSKTRSYGQCQCSGPDYMTIIQEQVSRLMFMSRNRSFDQSLCLGPGYLVNIQYQHGSFSSFDQCQCLRPGLLACTNVQIRNPRTDPGTDTESI